MNAPPIFETNRIHCFYKETYDLQVLPRGSSTSGFQRTYMPVTGVVVGASNLYDNEIVKYDLSVDFNKLRKLWVNGDELPIEELTVKVAKPVIETKVVSPPSYSDATNGEIRRLNERIRRFQTMKQKEESKGSPLRKIQQLDRRISWAQRDLDDTIRRADRALVRAPPQPVSQTVSQPVSRQPVQTYSDEDDDYSDEVEDDDPRPHVQPITQSIQPNRREPRELSDAREALSVERMGQNRPDVIQRLRATVNNLENANAMQTHIPAAILDESIQLARPTGAVTEDNVFDHLSILQWRDKDEFKMAPNALSRIPLQTLNEMYPIMQQLAIQLRTAISGKTGAIEAMEEEDRNNFLFHTIAKGREIYYQSLCDPDFCLYLLDNWQPLYSFMRKKLNRD